MYWIEPAIASSVVVVPGRSDVTWVQLDTVGAAGIVTPALYTIPSGSTTAQRVCTFDQVPEYSSSVTALLAVTESVVIFQAAYPQPMDRSLFRATLSSTGQQCGVPSLISPPGNASHPNLRASGPQDRVWTTGNVNTAGSYAIISTQTPYAPSDVYLVSLPVDVTSEAEPWSPLLLLSNSALAAAVASLPVPKPSYITIPSAVEGVSLNAVLYLAQDFDPNKEHPALM